MSISLFAIMTVGIVPLLASSLRGSNLSRSYTVGKNLAVESMEKIRGLPYNVSIGAQPTNGTVKTKVDVLDIYLPCATSSGCGGAGTNYNTAGVFTTTCTAGGIRPACPPTIPAGYTVTYNASFVQPNGSTPEQYTILTATTTPNLPATYDWQTTNKDRAPSKLAQIRVSVTWQTNGRAQSYDLETLKADRKFGSEKITGTGQVDYAVRAVTTFKDSAGRLSDLVATGASGTSSISLRLAALGGEVARAGQISLTREGTLTDPAQTLTEASPPPIGATSTLEAPPDQAPPSTSVPDSRTVVHPDICQDFTLSAALVPTCQRSQVGYLSSTENSALGVSASNERPSSSGTATFNPSASSFDMFVTGQRNTLGKNPLRLINETSYPSGGTISSPILSFRPNSGVADNDSCSPTAATIACRSMFAVTNGATGALNAADRRVETTARTGFAEARLFPVDFIDGSESGSKAVIRITDFTASVRCSATGSASAVASASWSARLRYYQEKVPDDGKTDGAYVSRSIDSSNFAAELAALKTSTGNPMVYEVPNNPTAIPPVSGPQQGDIYLFPKTDASGVHPSYLVDLVGTSPTASVGSGGRTASALITSALTLTTSPSDPDVPQSSLSLVMGALSCSAADRR